MATSELVRRALVGVLCLAATGWLLARAAASVAGSGSTLPWTLGRAAGLSAYALLLLLVCAGLLLAHPASRRLRWPTPVARIRLHISLAVFTLAFTVLHVVVLATDPWAHVGWAGALLPMASRYRPVGVTLGVLAVWSGLLTGLTAALAGRALGRVWWPVHKLAALAFLLVWVHGMTAGSDAQQLRGFYLATGAVVLVLALSRYHALAEEPVGS